MNEDQLKIMCALYTAFKSTNNSRNALTLDELRKVIQLDQGTLTGSIIMLRRVKYIQNVRGGHPPTRFALTAKGMTAYEEKRDEPS